ncbi:MAG: DUF935 family protein [Verrucomicrobiales bacterium]|nr:DUF935 family protein [Verrucomicrobiales bacterium]
MKSPKTATSISRVRSSAEASGRVNAIRYATPENIGRLLDAFYCGGFEIAKLWDSLEKRDPTVGAVVGKRKAAVGRMRWEILTRSDLKANVRDEAAKHAAALRGFYEELTCTSALKGDESGGVGLLAQQILDARGKEYSVHEWVWKLPRLGSSLSAEFRHCPMWWFENRTGVLRYLTDDGQIYGVPMARNEWLVSVAPSALMEATCVAWLFAHTCLNDWAIFCEKFGMPGLLGRTDAAPDSKEWAALVEAVKAFGQDWAAVVNQSANIEFISAGSAGEIPFPALADAMKREIAALWRGGDLGTFSSSRGGGTGASLQGREKTCLEHDDARFVSETLNARVDSRVIEYLFGEGVSPLAYFKLIPGHTENVSSSLAIDAHLLGAGLSLRRADFYERYSRRLPAPGEAVVGGSPSQSFGRAHLDQGNTAKSTLPSPRPTSPGNRTEMARQRFGGSGDTTRATKARLQRSATALQVIRVNF